MKRKIIASVIVVFLIIALIVPTFLSRCKGSDGPDGPSTEVPVTTTPPPPLLGYSIMNTFPHDTSFYTQGFTFYKGELYEGTGDPNERGRTRLMKINLKTGRATDSISLSKEFFGEGITILRDTLYQLTWQQHKVFVYKLKGFEKIKTYDLPTEGWGITNDGTRLIVSIGNGVLNYYDPSTFTLLSKISITEGSSDAYNLNELEYIDGYIYANQYTTSYILKIDPNSGKVVGKYDLTKETNKIKEMKPDADVLNGIAYDETTKKIYITGKYWPETYEIKLGQ